jgi:antitoxin CptB
VTAASAVSEMDRTRWRCRRGMLELDLVLARFLDRCLPDLSAEEMEAFKTLLELPDHELWDLVVGVAQPPSGAAGAIAERLRKL